MRTPTATSALHKCPFGVQAGVILVLSFVSVVMIALVGCIAAEDWYSYAGIAVFGGVSRMQPKMMKPSPMRKPRRVIIFRRNVNTAVMPVAFMSARQRALKVRTYLRGVSFSTSQAERAFTSTVTNSEFEQKKWETWKSLQ